MVYRPRDILSAAFEDDVQRLRLLILESAPGGLENDVEEELSEEDETTIDADEELGRLRKQYDISPDDADGDDIDEFGEEGEADLDDEEAEAQEADIDAYRRLVRRVLRDRATAALINQPGLLQAGTNMANVVSYGVLFSVREQSSSSEDPTSLLVEWKPSLRSPFPAYPLHWAVLGKAHHAIKFLVEHGADPSRVIGAPADTLYRAEKVEAAMAVCRIGSSSPNADEAAPSWSTDRFPIGLTPMEIAKTNKFLECVHVLETAMADRKEVLQKLEADRQKIESRLEQRKARKEKRRLAREQRRAAHEEAEERERAEEAEEGEDDGDGDEGDDEEYDD